MSQKWVRVWTQEEELTLVDGLKKLCANDWKEDDGTFKHGYLMELEQHLNACHPNCGLQALPHIFFKNKRVEKALYDPIVEEIFHKDGVTEQSVKGPEVGVQEIERIEAQEVTNDMPFEFPIIDVDEDDAPAKKEDQIAQGEPSVSAGATQSSWSAF
ncbi:hypothetical protein KY285_007430 [Solanum tuberosum]|nr:hypothetical protein KY284_007530 [Solanum tuberosum]KAH0745773.1 hypothetical protein KY285_007430 [Solanum tuberosum]